MLLSNRIYKHIRDNKGATMIDLITATRESKNKVRRATIRLEIARLISSELVNNRLLFTIKP